MAKRGPRPSFDRNEALHRAMRLFWDNGYEGTTINQLKDAMGGLCAPSVYAAFGSKEALFREAVDLYSMEQYVGWQEAFAQRDTRSAIESLLRGAVISYSTPGQPRGCLVDLGTTNSCPGNGDIQHYLRGLRQDNQQRIEARLRKGVEDGDLDPNSNVEVLAVYYNTVLQGISTQANDGATREVMMAIVDCAMMAWKS